MSLTNWIILVLMLFAFNFFLVLYRSYADDKKIDNDEVKELQDIALTVCKNTIELIGLDNIDAVIGICVREILAQLEKENITIFTETEIRVVVNLIVNTLTGRKNSVAKYQSFKK